MPRNGDSSPQPTQHFPDLYDLINLKPLSLVVDEVGANEKAKEISTTKETPILIRHQRRQWTVFLSCFELLRPGAYAMWLPGRAASLSPRSLRGLPSGAITH